MKNQEQITEVMEQGVSKKGFIKPLIGAVAVAAAGVAGFIFYRKKQIDKTLCEIENSEDSNELTEE